MFTLQMQSFVFRVFRIQNFRKLELFYPKMLKNLNKNRYILFGNPDKGLFRLANEGTRKLLGSCTIFFNSHHCMSTSQLLPNIVQYIRQINRKNTNFIYGISSRTSEQNYN